LGIRINHSKLTTDGGVDWTYTAKVNIATSADTLVKQVAGHLVQPANGTGFKAALIDVRRPDVWKSMGLRGYASLSNGFWSDGLDAVSASVLGLGVLGSWQVKVSDEANAVVLQIEVGPCLRGVFGDIAANDAFRASLLTTDSKWFPGAETGLSITVNKITAGLQFYLIRPTGGGRVPGVTGGQISTGVSLEAPLFSIAKQ